MRNIFLSILLIFLFIFTGCAPKEVNLATINPPLAITPGQKIATYDSDKDLILFYHFTLKDAKLVEITWGKVIPFRIEFMDLWVTGLGHDLRRLTNGNAEELRAALMYSASEKGMRTLHINQKDFILDYTFAEEIVNAIETYEEKMKRYERDRKFPLILQH